MKNKILATLESYLKKQRYPYLWEVALFSMKNNISANQFVSFVKNGVLEQPMAAITAPQHATLKKTDKEIINLIKAIKQDENQVCILIAHADYNPANLQAVYVLDCNDGEEEECYQRVVERWNQCSELYFCRMKEDYVKNVVIEYEKKNN